MTESTPPEPEYQITQDPMLCHAWDIVHGKAGGDYIYSLEEDYIYTYEDNVWKKILEKEFLNRVERNMIKITSLPIHKRREIMENFKVKKHMRIEGFNKTNLINFENCMFDPSTQIKFPHAKEHFSTIRIPYKYDPEATCPLWIKTLNEVLEEDQDKINLFQEFIAYCLLPDMNQKKALLLLGESDCGKSTLLFIVKYMLGEQNCSSVGLEYLPNPQYTPLLINKMVNIDADVSRDAGKYEREFKIITSGEPVSCNQKHIPTFEFIPKCKIILAANIFPKITDHSSAFYNRLLLIPCNRIFLPHEQDNELVFKLKQELPGIFNWALEGLKRFKERGKFQKYDFVTDAVEELENENNPCNLFFQEHVEVSMGSYIEKGDLYKKYKEWSDNTKNYALSENRFSTNVFKKFNNQTPKNTRLDNGGRRIWKNLIWVPFKSQPSKPAKVVTEEEY